MRKTSVLSIIFCFSLFVSCTSTSLIPGSSERNKKNLYSEYFLLGNSYCELKQYDKAVTFYNKALEDEDLFWGVKEKLARVYALQGKWEEASEIYNSLLLRDSENTVLKESLAYVYAMKGDFDSALNVYADLLEKYPESQELNENSLLILFAAEKYEEAENRLSEFELKFPDNKNIKNFHDKLDEKKSEESVEDPSDLVENPLISEESDVESEFSE